MPSLVMPEHLDEVWPYLEEKSTTIYAGGTDALVKLRAGALKPRQLVCLEQIPELQGVEEAGDRVLIKAGTSLTRLLADPLLQHHFPVLIQAVRVLGSPAIRNMGTIGGNICSASPAGDTLPPLYALEAEVEMKSRNAGRRLSIRDFIRGPGETDLKPGELLTGIRITKQPQFNRQHYEKVGQRKAMAIALVSLAALISLNPDGVVADIRLAWGSAGPTVVTAPAVESAVRGRPLTPEILREAAELARRAVSPINDLRAGADYRRAVAGNLLYRLGLLMEPVPSQPR